MNIYFVSRYSRLKGPFDILDSHREHIIKFGDICLRDTIEGVAFYVVNNSSNSWNACKLVGIGKNDILHEIGNTLLFSFDGLSRRKGEIALIKQIAPCFREKVIDDLFRNAIDILEYKKDFWECSLFPKFFAASKELIERSEVEMPEASPDSNLYPSVFAKYLSKELLEPLIKSLDEGFELKEAYLTLRENHPVLFRKALLMFLTENPQGTIYDKLDNNAVSSTSRVVSSTEDHTLIQKKMHREVMVDDLQSYILNEFNSTEFNRRLNQYRKGETKAFDQIVKSNLKLVEIIAASYKGHGVELDDLVQEGTFGLMKAIKRFNPKRNVQFPFYAKWWIHQSLVQALINMQSMVKIPYNQVTLHSKVRRCIERYEQEHGYEPSSSDIVIDENADSKNISFLRSLPDSLSNLTTCSIDLDSYSSNDFTADETIMRESQTLFINSALNKLKKREEYIIRHLYGIGVKSEALSEIGERIGLTRERVRQIAEKAVQHLRELLK